MLNVLYISHFPDMKMGGQQSMMALIKHLDRARVKPFAIVPSEGELSKELRKIGCETFVVPLTSLKPKNIFIHINNIKLIRKIISEKEIDIIHPDHERDSIIAGIAKLFTASKMIWHVRLTRAVSTDNLSVRLSDGIIGISNDIRLRFKNQEQIKKKFTTIYNGVDCDLFVPLDNQNSIRIELKLPLNKYLINFTGQFKEGKGIFDIIEAAKILKDNLEEKKVIFILIGTPESPEFYEEMKRRISNYSLNDYFIILSQQSNIYRFMQASDLLLLPSHEETEGMGRVLFEAMACGTPVIATNVKGVREAVSVETGILVNEKSPNELAEAIKKYLYYKEVQISKAIAGRKRALELFDIKIHAKNVMNFYDKIKKA